MLTQTCSPRVGNLIAGSIAIFFASIILIACQTSSSPDVLSLSSALPPTMAVVHLPQPERTCPTTITWHGLRPGMSTQQDVINALGQPSEKGFRRNGDNSFAFYSYKVIGGVVAEYATDRIYFRADWVVDWIEAVVGDRDGAYHTVAETSSEVGNILDIAYLNNNSSPYGTSPDKIHPDVLAGPDEVYVWSECGIALDVIQSEVISDVLTARHPDPYDDTGKRSPKSNSIVLIKFLFIPTSYDGFKNYFMYKVPYSLGVSDKWDRYIRIVGDTH